MEFEREKWIDKIKQPLWYQDVPDLLEQYDKLFKSNPEQYDKLREESYSFFEEQLKLGNVCLGNQVGPFDRERKPIDTIVIHHTSIPPGMTGEKLSAIELIRLYAPTFANPKYESDKHLAGELLYSGHVRNGQQVFYPYHWIIRGDGRFEQLLFDNEVGWHAGDWEINCRSVAIAFDNDYENSRPSNIELETTARIIGEKYPMVSKKNILGHREVNPKTTCPSNLFLSNDNQRGWKEDLLDLL